MPTHSPISFSLGALVATPNALQQIDNASVLDGLRRHARGVWGTICQEDKDANDLALRDGTRLLSAYAAKDGTKFWIITEAERSATTVLRP